jgi:hypothetical protein
MWIRRLSARDFFTKQVEVTFKVPELVNFDKFVSAVDNKRTMSPYYYQITIPRSFQHSSQNPGGSGVNLSHFVN